MTVGRFVSVKLAAFAVVSMVAVAAPSAKADDVAARQSLESAKELFAQRSSTSMAAIDQAIATLERAQAEAQDKMLKYDILILASRALYFKGTHTSGNDAKKDLHKRGQEKADAAEELSTEYSEAPYFAGINLGRWGQANGIISSLTQVPVLKKYMAKAMDRVTRNDDDGESIDGYGPHRTLGRLFKKLPGMFGGSRTESLKHLDKAVKGDPTLALNTVYLADTLRDGNAADKAEATRILNELLAKDPNTLNPNRVAETGDEFKFARDLLAGKEID